uniref:EGF-like domain-containing protein n=1 Tax=Haemonchus contortus TaxID=6289 RepID=A0A7I4Y2L8_HAECO
VCKFEGLYRRPSTMRLSPNLPQVFVVLCLVLVPATCRRAELSTLSGGGGASGLSSLRRSLACIGNETFACNDGRCIPRSWRCDGDIDCKNEEDERNCTTTCGPEEFQCSKDQPVPAFKSAHQTCIPSRWVCDGEFDCEDRSDERNCPDVKCTENQFTCSEFDGQFKLCIPKSWQCDGQKDCASGADEENCEKRKCEDNDFQCANGICIFKNWKCDGEDDCGDRSDETNCTESLQQICDSKHMFKCHTEGCISKDWVCDGEADCFDHSDERNCTDTPHECAHPETEFACASGRYCINRMWYCDGEEDCPDGSDERNCASARECVKGERKCPSSNLCISESQWCNGIEDCPDGSDEMHCPKNGTVESCDPITKYTCPTSPPVCVKYSDLCVKRGHNDCGDDITCAKNIAICTEKSDYCDCHNSFVKNVQICHCRAGFRAVNGKCEDINECEQPGACDQICVNTPGSYACRCHHGYKLSRSPNSTVPNRCRALGGDPLLLLSNRATIRQFDLVTNVHVPLIQSPGSAVAMDFHLENGTLVWSDIALQKILMCKIGNDSVHHHLAVRDKCAEGEQSVLLDSNVHTPDGLAVDWIHNLLFWTDGGLDQVNVMDLETGQKRTLFYDGLEEPRAIAVDPEMGLIFWTDWGKEARIERAGMDGQHRTVIVKGERVKWPNGLALDYIDKRVYWADAKVKSIFSCDYWGRDVKIILHSHQYLRHPFSIAVFEDRIYYTDWEHDGVITINKFTGGEMRTVMQKVSTPMTVRIYHRLAQPKLPNKCYNSGCEQMCLPRAVYRKTEPALETEWHDRPYACMCQGDTPTDLIECAVDIATGGAGRGFSLSTMLFFLMLAIFGVMGVVYYRKRNSSGAFTALNFDNPIYRRTTEPDMDDPFRDPFSENNGVQIGPGNARLVMADPEENVHNSSIEPMDRPLTT